MATTFQKRQKEMKRQEKARAKAERRMQKKSDDPNGVDGDGIAWEPGNNTDGFIPENVAGVSSRWR